MRVVDFPLHHTMILQHFQPVRERIRGNTAQRVFKIGEAPGAMIDQFSDDLTGPPRPNDEGRARHWAEGQILFRHCACLSNLLYQI